jgi:murein DD-endopeptidase MepM/ murein hydrolase activator NlpD
MRKFLKAFLISLSILVGSTSSMSPQGNDMEVSYIINAPEAVTSARFFYHLRIEEADKISTYPILFPIKEADFKRISSEFGMRKHPIFGYRRHHNGIDIAADKGTDVICTGKGIVSQTRFAIGYGNQILIDHANGYTTRYAHLSEILVNVGDTVNMFTVIGRVGSTGHSTGPHLHYEVILNGNPFDPMSIYGDTLSKENYLTSAYEVNNHFSSYSDKV